VATAVGGNAELVEHGVTGYLVPSDAPRELAEAVGELLRDGDRARSMGAAGRAAARSRFSLERMVKDYEAMYVRLLKAKRTALPCAVSAGY
jgi:glycosyltransferase involved in cell wall biosynthesis